MDILVLLLGLDLSLGADREEISVQGNVDVLPLKSGQFCGNLDFLIGFGNLYSRRKHSRAIERNAQRASKILAHHRVEVELAKDLPMVKVDPVLFDQVLFNLLDNASKYAPAGTTVRIQSWRDLPMLVNQWANVVRWELRTRMFLRTTEFLWQEGHTAHSTHEEALEEVLRMLDVYADVAENVMAVPVIRGLKTQSEKFAGALSSYSIEAMMQNGLALQAGTSHDLGQNFGRAFNVQFQSKEGQLDYVWQTSWGVSTRLIGCLIMAHSDDKGLVLPPKLAPNKAVLVPIYRKDEERASVLEAARNIAGNIGAKLDDREGPTPGAKFYHWERRGVPVVLELGPRDLASSNIVLKRRDTGVKEVVAQSEIAARLPAVLDQIQGDLYNAARQRLKDNTVLANSIEEVEDILRSVTAEKGGGKFVMAHMKDHAACDARIKEFKATIRCIPLTDEYDGPGKCIVTGQPVDRRVVIAKAY